MPCQQRAAPQARREHPTDGSRVLRHTADSPAMASQGRATMPIGPCQQLAALLARREQPTKPLGSQALRCTAGSPAMASRGWATRPTDVPSTPEVRSCSCWTPSSARTSSPPSSEAQVCATPRAILPWRCDLALPWAESPEGRAAGTLEAGPALLRSSAALRLASPVLAGALQARLSAAAKARWTGLRPGCARDDVRLPPRCVAVASTSAAGWRKAASARGPAAAGSVPQGQPPERP
eukprot:scaffold387_cov63-Phaeocystis_antarctica.AAC.5